MVEAERLLLERVREVTEKGDLPAAAIERAVRKLHPRWAGFGPVPHALVREAVELARDYADAAVELTPPAFDQAPPQAALEETPFARVASDELLALLDGESRELRTRLFGSEEPPFAHSAYSEAVDWIRREERALPLLSTEQLEKAERLMDGLRELANDLSSTTGEEVRFSFPHKDFYYEDADGIRRAAAADPRTRLHEFAEFVVDAANLTGASQEDIVRHVLCGTEVEPPRVTVSTGRWRGWLRGTRVARDQVVAAFLSPDLTKDEIATVVGHVLNAWESRGEVETRARITEADELLFRIMVELGGEERDRRGERQPRGYWKRVLERWIEAGGVPSEKAPVNALQVRWREFQAKRPHHIRTGKDVGDEQA